MYIGLFRGELTLEYYLNILKRHFKDSFIRLVNQGFVSQTEIMVVLTEINSNIGTETVLLVFYIFSPAYRIWRALGLSI